MSNMQEKLLNNNALLYVATTGAGLSFQYNLWKKPGCSKYLVGFFTPYAKTELQSFLGFNLEESFVSKEIAMDLAMAAYIKAVTFKVKENNPGNPIGIGITAAVATNRLPRGEQRAFICLITKDISIIKEVLLNKELGEEYRKVHDQIIANEAESILISGIDLDNKYVDITNEVLERFYKYPTFFINSRSSTSLGTALYLPASLNPIHDGHREMIKKAEEKLSTTFGKVFGKYLISTSSPHKGDLTLQEILFKVGMLRAETNFREFEFTKEEPLFLDKARKRPGSCFIIGADTMERFLDPKWGPDPSEMLNELKELNITFLVMGRVIDNVFKTVDDINVPEMYRDLFISLQGRIDVSSTEIRQKKESTI